MPKTLNISEKEPENGKHVNQYGDQTWFKDGERHRDGAPAFISPTGFRSWYQYGKLHRTDGPAAYNLKKGAAWYQYDKRHRDNGPAIISFRDPPESDIFFLDGIEVKDPLIIKMILAKGVRDNEPRTKKSFYI